MYRRKQAGSALLIAIFIILVMTLLAASLVSLQRDSADSTSYEVYAARAYLAAYSASEIALAELLVGTADNLCDDLTSSPVLPDETGFHGCTVSNACTSTTASNDIDTLYKITSTAVCATGDIITRRQITVGATLTASFAVEGCFTVESGNYTQIVKLNNSEKSSGDDYYASSDLLINGNNTYSGTLYVDGNVSVTGNATVTGTIYATGTVNVSGNGEFTGTLISSTISKNSDGSLTVCKVSDDNSENNIDIIYRLQTFD